MTQPGDGRGRRATTRAPFGVQRLDACEDEVAVFVVDGDRFGSDARVSSAGVGAVESVPVDGPDGRVASDGPAFLVDQVMVVPAQRDPVRDIGRAAVVPPHEVMRLTVTP